MRRFTDSLFFGVLALLAAVSWAIMSQTSALPAVEYGRIATMSVALGVVIATPALILAALLGLFRSLMNVTPIPFWTWMTIAFALAATLMWSGGWVTELHGVALGFQAGVWFTAITAVASFMAVVLSVTGAIPAPLTKAQRQERRSEAKAQAHAAKVQAKSAKAAEKSALKAARDRDKIQPTVSAPDGEETVEPVEPTRELPLDASGNEETETYN